LHILLLPTVYFLTPPYFQRRSHQKRHRSSAEGQKDRRPGPNRLLLQVRGVSRVGAIGDKAQTSGGKKHQQLFEEVRQGD
jgi:hypothetical protein